ncbi:MAG: hypothetical protein JXQ67_07915 [Campylobacterales bacterium]|nr:hypothetical protein [Campylobacterales bacterium]
MSKIVLDVHEHNVEIVLNILENLKDGLITKIECDGVKKYKQHTQYKPKLNKITYESESGTNDQHGKYLSAAAYKRKLQK